MTQHPGNRLSMLQRQQQWYDLFSRGSRDWLRHNQKISDAVKKSLPDLIADSDIMSGSGDRTVKVPVRFLEHYRFQLADANSRDGVGQAEGDLQAGDVLKPGDQPASSSDGEGNGAGRGEGGYGFVLEMKIDEIVDWMWEELELPNLKPKLSESLQDKDYVREGIDRRGVRSRLDRRRTMKEAIKRRAVYADSPAITNDDLRFRQLAKRKQPSTNAVVIFALDVSSSMAIKDRKLAKTFFFWTLQGLRKQYRNIQAVFVAHTVKAWEFDEPDFFQVKAQGGTEASNAFQLVDEICQDRYPAANYNTYMFYASDGDNFMDDRDKSTGLLRKLSAAFNFTGYIEVGATGRTALATEMGRIFASVAEQGVATGSFSLTGHEDVWSAIKTFFNSQVSEDAG